MNHRLRVSGNPVVRFGGNAALSSTVPIQLFPNTNSPLTVLIAFDTFANDAQRCVVNWRIQDDLGTQLHDDAPGQVEACSACGQGAWIG